MFILYTVVIIFIGIIALVGTLVAGRQVDRTIETLDNLSVEEQEKHLRDHHFKNEKRNLGILTWIYVVTFLIAIAGAVMYMAFFR